MKQNRIRTWITVFIGILILLIIFIFILNVLILLIPVAIIIAILGWLANLLWGGKRKQSPMRVYVKKL